MNSKQKYCMGIKFLNRFLLNQCSNKAIKKTEISQLSNKIIVIDTSIYLYKYLSENALIENMTSLILLFKTYNIKPIFIFDGKPPLEKLALLYQRRLKKKEAAREYEKLKGLIDSGDAQINSDLEEQMSYYKKQSIFITEQDITKVKQLLDLQI